MYKICERNILPKSGFCGCSASGVHIGICKTPRHLQRKDPHLCSGALDPISGFNAVWDLLLFASSDYTTEYYNRREYVNQMLKLLVNVGFMLSAVSTGNWK